MSEKISRFEATLVVEHVNAARAGQQRAYAWLYAQFLPLVHAILLGRYRPAVADELCQECFTLAFERLQELREPEKFGGWIAMIARRAKPAASQDSSWAPLGEHEVTQATPDDAAEAERLLRALAALPEAYRETLMLRLVEGMSGPEIATLTNMTPDSVRVNLHRGMAKLRSALGIHCKEANHD
jgi:RNA polymerase sigma-70 factor, ECF subfamily